MNSTPLGALLDHGSDALNAVLGSMVFLHMIDVNGRLFYIMIAAVSISFYLPILSEYP